MLSRTRVAGEAQSARPFPAVEHVTEQRGRERLIAAARMLLADVVFLAVALDPAEPARHAEFVSAALFAYAVYAFVSGIHALTTAGLTRRWSVATHIVDLGSAIALVAFTEGSTSPFFVFVVFPLLPAALRWGWRGTMFTALIAALGFIGVGLQEVFVLNDPRFALNRLLIGVVHIAVLAIVLAALAAYHARSRRTIVELAAWTAAAAPEDDEFHCDLLGHVAATVNAPRVVLLWRPSEATTATTVEWAADAAKESTDDPTVLETAVIGRLRDAHFLCTRANGAVPKVMYASSTGLRRWRGSPVSNVFRGRFAPTSILSFRLRADGIVGRLFVLDKRRLTIDDFTLGGLVAQQVANSLEHRAALQRIRDEAVLEERARIARDVHDDVLQSMTALSLGLETVGRLMERSPERARESLAELQVRVNTDQRVLRTAVQGMRRRDGPPPYLGRQLSDLVKNLEQEWSLPIKLDIKLRDVIVPEALGREVRLIVREAVVNAARHAHPSVVYVGVSMEAEELRLSVDDNGCGFSFSGRIDDAERRQRGIGPTVLAERVEALGGTLDITSSPAGSRLDIGIPLG